MSEKIEVNANSLKDALQRAAIHLETTEDQLKYRIVTEKTRYFGHKQKEIFIEAWMDDGSETDKLQGFLRQLIAGMKLELKYSLEDQKSFLRVNFQGEDYRLMLYQNGNLLNAIQYILNRLFSDELEKKIFCECENYRKKKESELSTLAHRYAKQVKRSGKPIELPELTPFERRIIHMTINKYNDLESKSQGDSFLKVITIRKRDNGQ